MKRDLAEKLLSHYLEWGAEQKAQERRLLEALAAYKYDEYQQFAPGRRFVESLALWLRQFRTVQERRDAYEFIKTRLVFVSNAEMNHLVQLAFPTIIRPNLIQEASRESSIPQYRVKAICRSLAYRRLLRRTLFLGLSDGARTDQLRRSNPHNISNEQIWHAYDVSSSKVVDLRKELKRDLESLGHSDETEVPAFSTVVLLDDFTASGTSYIRRNASTGAWEGKIPKVLLRIGDDENLGSIIDKSNVKVLILIYVAASQAIGHIRQMINEIEFGKGNIEFAVLYEISDDTRLRSPRDAGILSIAANPDYFDAAVDDENAAVGGSHISDGLRRLSIAGRACAQYTE